MINTLLIMKKNYIEKGAFQNAVESIIKSKSFVFNNKSQKENEEIPLKLESIST